MSLTREYGSEAGGVVAVQSLFFSSSGQFHRRASSWTGGELTDAASTSHLCNNRTVGRKVCERGRKKKGGSTIPLCQGGVMKMELCQQKLC